ncbi:hypothetical protein JK358_31460 [Nocardia sp. 2]|uniref:Uncharacterized protein n=1 Tax=Nocardia acididurans TaxID=2802282 RepID=A0ABS1ME58_9NOCA|nr:hypothetical protein [Nocardia acididurans]MBL1078931.1 hypothetical protein [Nocardia acididurans]
MSARHPPESHRLCHLRVRSGLLVLDFRATLAQARNFLAALDTWSPTMHATIDNDVSPDLPALPCSSLWD